MADWDDPTAKQWVQHVLEKMKPEMEASAAIAQIVPDDPEGDVKFWVELGASIMMEKPIVAVVFPGRTIPPKLARIADEIVHLPDGVTPAASEDLADAIDRAVERGPS